MMYEHQKLKLNENVDVNVINKKIELKLTKDQLMK